MYSYPSVIYADLSITIFSLKPKTKLCVIPSGGLLSHIDSGRHTQFPTQRIVFGARIRNNPQIKLVVLKYTLHARSFIHVIKELFMNQHKKQ